MQRQTSRCQSGGLLDLETIRRQYSQPAGWHRHHLQKGKAYEQAEQAERKGKLAQHAERDASIPSPCECRTGAKQ